MIWLRISYSAGIAFAIAAIWWTHVLSEERIRRWYAGLYVIGLFLAFIAPIDGLVVHDVQKIVTSGFITKGGPFFHWYTVFISTCLFLGLKAFYIGYKKSTGIRRAQIKTILYGGTVFVVLVLSFDFLIPSLFNYFILSSLDIPATFVLISVTAYSMLRYRLMDIDVLMKRVVMYLLVALLVYAIFHGVSAGFIRLFGSLWSASAMVSIAFVAFGFAYLISKAQAGIFYLVNTYWYTHSFRAEQAIKKLNDTIVAEVNLTRLLTILVRTVGLTFGVNKTACIVVHNKKTVINSYGLRALKRQKIKRYIPLLRSVEKMAIYDELDYLKKERKSRNARLEKIELFFKETDFCVIIPLIDFESGFAVMLLGRKQKKRFFTREDLALLNTLANQGAIAIHNAVLYEHLSDKNKDLSRLLELKGEFLDMASHRLRTPISVIRSTTNILLEHKNLLSKEEGMHLIHSASVELNDMVDDMLLASQVDVSGFSISRDLFQPVKLKPLIEEVVERFLVQSKEHRVALAINVSKDVEVIAYYKYAEVVLDNLINNALKYMPEDKKGRITISVNESGGMVRMSVKDNGPGISEKVQKRIFHKFVRGDMNSGRAQEGTGLGLFIVQKIMKAHPRGDYGVSSEPGRGSEFWVSFKSAR